MAGSTLASPTVRAPAALPRARPFSPGREAWRRFRRHRLAVASVAILAAMVLAVLLGPLVWLVPINDIDFTARLSPPTWAHPFGTDDLGQDLLARMLYGGRISLAVGLAAMLVAIFAGVLVGAVASISRGSVDAGLMWLPISPVAAAAAGPPPRNLPVPGAAEGDRRAGGRRVPPHRRRHRRLP